LAQAHYANQIISRQNTYGQIDENDQVNGAVSKPVQHISS
jgi:hypothetical protein